MLGRKFLTDNCTRRGPQLKNSYEIVGEEFTGGNKPRGVPAYIILTAATTEDTITPGLSYQRGGVYGGEGGAGMGRENEENEDSAQDETRLQTHGRIYCSHTART